MFFLRSAFRHSPCDKVNVLPVRPLSYEFSYLFLVIDDDVDALPIEEALILGGGTADVVADRLAVGEELIAERALDRLAARLLRVETQLLAGKRQKEQFKFFPQLVNLPRNARESFRMVGNPASSSAILELLNPSHDVPELHEIRRYPDFEALRLGEGSSETNGFALVGRSY